MESDFLVQWLPVAFFFALTIVPALRILRKAGRSLAWGLLTLIPVFGLIALLWILAFVRWYPQEDRQNG
jgi:uncharacterized membrane protein YhaH (DUF805 family)